MLMEALVAIDIERTAGIIILSFIHSKPAKIAPKFPAPSQSIVRTGWIKALFATPLFRPATIPKRIHTDLLMILFRIFFSNVNPRLCYFCSIPFEREILFH